VEGIEHGVTAGYCPGRKRDIIDLSARDTVRQGGGLVLFTSPMSAK
jgi:hypothetical protein